jgi:hypothetical protein
MNQCGHPSGGAVARKRGAGSQLMSDSVVTDRQDYAEVLVIRQPLDHWNAIDPC